MPQLVPGGFLSARLMQWQERWLVEFKKAPIEWRLDSFVTELAAIQADSEDTGEALLAQSWIDYLRQRLTPIQENVKALERARAEAREKEQSSEAKSKDIGKVVPRDPPDASGFLAKGWVYTMSKNRTVEGSHRLMRGNKLLYYLVSEHIDLNQYVYKRVGIQGVLEELPTEAGARMIRVTSVVVLSD
jgi:hypothetical protein